MNGNVHAEIEYSGILVGVTGRETEAIMLPESVENLQRWIVDYVKKMYAINQPILILVNGKSIIWYMKEHHDEKIQEGIHLKILPVFSGG